MIGFDPLEWLPPIPLKMKFHPRYVSFSSRNFTFHPGLGGTQRGCRRPERTCAVSSVSVNWVRISLSNSTLVIPKTLIQSPYPQPRLLCIYSKHFQPPASTLNAVSATHRDSPCTFIPNPKPHLKLPQYRDVALDYTNSRACICHLLVSISINKVAIKYRI